MARFHKTIDSLEASLQKADSDLGQLNKYTACLDLRRRRHIGCCSLSCQPYHLPYLDSCLWRIRRATRSLPQRLLPTPPGGAGGRYILLLYPRLLAPASKRSRKATTLINHERRLPVRHYGDGGGRLALLFTYIPRPPAPALWQ